MSLDCPRRYYLLKRRAAAARFDAPLAEAWAAKQLAEPGEALAEGFPLRTRLASAGYVAREDLLGANEEELQQAGLTAREAAAVLAAL